MQYIYKTIYIEELHYKIIDCIPCNKIIINSSNKLLITYTSSNCTHEMNEDYIYNNLNDILENRFTSKINKLYNNNLMEINNINSKLISITPLHI